MGDAAQAHESALSFGGLAGVRDISLIESAIGRPYSGYYRSIESKAAALTHSLVKNHGFTDGNKRTALLLLVLFLNRSGYRLKDNVSDTDIEDMILDVATDRHSFDGLTDWIKSRIRRR